MDRLIIYVIGRKIWNGPTEAKKGWSLSTPNDFLPSRLSRIRKTYISCINVKRNLDPVDFKKEPKWRFDLGNLEASRPGTLPKYLFITSEIEFGCKYSLSSICLRVVSVRLGAKSNAKLDSRGAFHSTKTF